MFFGFGSRAPSPISLTPPSCRGARRGAFWRQDLSSQMEPSVAARGFHFGTQSSVIQEHPRSPTERTSPPNRLFQVTFLKRKNFPASLSDYRWPRGRKIDRPSDFVILGRSRGSAARCGRRPGELETWNSGIRAARRGGRRRGPAGPRSACVGRTRAAAIAAPMARRRASRVPRGTRLRVLAECSRTHVPQGIAVRLLGALHRGFIGCVT